MSFRPRMDKRVAALLSKAGDQDKVQITHQEIAAELGSSREFIHRILQDFSQRGGSPPAEARWVSSRRKS